MTFSLNDRRQNYSDALTRMTEDVGEMLFDSVDFEAKSKRYEDILGTTWDELMERGYISYRWIDTYNLTTAGWREGILLLGWHNAAPLKPKLEKLMAVLKKRVDGRSELEGYVDISEAVTETGISEQLIRNVLEGKVIEYGWNRIGAKLDVDGVIVIPRRFGQEPL
jgi:hypothetical protein